MPTKLTILDNHDAVSQIESEHFGPRILTVISFKMCHYNFLSNDTLMIEYKKKLYQTTDSPGLRSPTVVLLRA